MILNALSDYYQRLADDPTVDIAPFGWFHGRIDYVVTLNRKGEFVSLTSQKQHDGKKLRGRQTLMPCIGRQALKHANSGKDANLLWDNSSFVLGLGNKGNLKLNSFISVIRDNLSDLNDQSIKSIIRFLEKGKQDPDCFSPVLEHVEYGKEISAGRANITFALDGDKSPFVFARPIIKQRISELEFNEGAPTGICLISGRSHEPIELCHPVIKGIYKTKPTDPDPNYISFNKQAFVSFGKKQSANAPSSKAAVFAYSAALNHLLASEHQCMQVGDASTVFWAKNPCDFEKAFHPLLSPKKGEQAVSYEKIRSLLRAVRAGLTPEEADMPFYVLGLSPNASRIAVRFYYSGDLKEIKERVAGHFQDTEIIRNKKDPEYLSLYQLLLTIVPSKEKERPKKIPPNLSGELMRSVLGGTPYPRTLFANAIRRCKAEQNVTHERASIIKGVLSRMARLSNSKQKEVTVALDKSYDNIGYVLGRLFAVLEWIQEVAHTPEGKKRPSIKKTIRDTYFGAATSSPLITFKRLDELSVHHLAKIRNSGKSIVWLEHLKQDVFGHIPAKGIPSILNLEDQGRFSVGYYHQRKDFFTKKGNGDKGES